LIQREALLAWLGHRLGKPPGWERLVRWLAGPDRFRGRGDLCLVRDGLAFIAQPTVPLGWHVAMFGTYEPELRAILAALLKPGMVAVDVGANVGWHTLLMARQVGSAGRVLAVEANPSVRQRLALHVAINGLSQVEILPYALAASAGRLSFFGPAEDDAESGNGHVVAEAAGAKRPTGLIEVEARTLDSVVESTRLTCLDLIKIDVEGYEWPVLQGAEGSISRFRPHVFFEYVGEYVERGGGSADKLVDFFERHAYQLFTLSRNWSERVTRDNWPDCADIWAVPMVLDRRVVE
jgi:FkbM family methyltransferase